MTVADPIRSPRAYNAIGLDEVVFDVSKVKVYGGSSPRKWDKVDGQGTTGATVKYNGDGLAEFTVNFYLWEPEHFDFFETHVRPKIKRPAEKEKPKPISVDYPELAKLEVKRAVVTNVGQLEEEGQGGLFFYPVSFLQFRPPKPVQVLKASGDGSSSDPSKPLDPQDQMIAELTKQLKEEAAK